MALGAADGALGASPSQSALPKRRLGKTGEMVSCIGFGSGTRFCSIQEEDAAQALLERAFALGINYFDTAGILYAAATGAVERETARRVFQGAAQRNLSRHQD